MGRKQITCEIGDIFGCYKVLSLPKVEGEHSYVDVECLNCGNKYHLALSEIKNRPKQGCKKCHCRSKYKYTAPNIGDTFGNQKVVDNDIKTIKGHRSVLCSCIKCGVEKYVRLERIYTCTRVSCTKCKQNVEVEKVERAKIIFNRKQNQPFLTKFHRICNNDLLRSIYIDISPEFLKELWNKQGGKCALTGDILPDVIKASLDRIDSSKGYTTDNVQWVTKQANLAKHIMSQTEFIEFCKRVVNHANQQPSFSLTTEEGSETNS